MGRGCWVKYGVDPRSDVSFRVYQTMDMRSVNGRSSKAVKKIVKAKEAKKLLEISNMNDSWVSRASYFNVRQSHVFDGLEYTHCRTFQLADLTHPDFKSLVNSIAYCRNEAHISKDGWYIEGHMGVIREKLKYMINQVKSARMDRLLSSKGPGAVQDADSSAEEDLEDDVEGAGAMLHNFFNQLGDEDEFDILEEDDWPMICKQKTMTSPLSAKKIIKVLLLDPLPEGTRNAFSSPLYSVDSCFSDLTEAELVKKVQEYNVICLR